MRLFTRVHSHALIKKRLAPPFLKTLLVSRTRVKGRSSHLIDCYTQTLGGIAEHELRAAKIE